MKNKTITYLLFASLFCFCINTINAQELFRADFESYDTTPYFFRFGNKGKIGEYTYRPRWMYSHEIIANPVTSAKENPSSTVLKYTSMEARNYGLKFLFGTSISIDDFKKVVFKIYQPKNVLGQETYDGEAPATKQNICIKLLCKFNTINDFKQDDGIVLYKSTAEFTTQGSWVTYSFDFNKAEYETQLSKFSNGVVGIAILPTYNSDVTLNIDEQYTCYLDDIIVTSRSTGINNSEYSKEHIKYSNGQLIIQTQEDGIASATIYDIEGRLIKSLSNIRVENGIASENIKLNKNKIYLVRVTIGKQCYNQKICNQ